LRPQNIFTQIIIGILLIILVALIGLASNSETTMAQPKIETVVHIEGNPLLKEYGIEKRSGYSRSEQLTKKELKSLLHAVGFRGERLKQAWAIAMKESTGRPRSHNNNTATGDNSYGLFQINMIDSLGPARREQFNLKSNSDLFDPIRNAEIAFFMSNKGKNWSSWNGITDSTVKWMSEFPG
jgi:hypothetical protein